MTQQILAGDKVATWKDLVFLHPLISAGDGMFIEKAKNGLVRIRHAASFPPGQKVQVMHRPPPHEAKRVVARALARLGPEPYDPLSANCQHFANEVTFGVRKSEQVEGLKALLVVGGVCLLASVLLSRGGCC